MTPLGLSHSMLKEGFSEGEDKPRQGFSHKHILHQHGALLAGMNLTHNFPLGERGFGVWVGDKTSVPYWCKTRNFSV